jgi:hypothetical protein
MGMLRAPNRHVERVFSDRKDPDWGTSEAGEGSMTRGLNLKEAAN